MFFCDASKSFNEGAAFSWNDRATKTRHNCVTERDRCIARSWGAPKLPAEVERNASSNVMLSGQHGGHFDQTRLGSYLHCQVRSRLVPDNLALVEL